MMNIHDTTEQAYKNGYNKGYQDGIKEAYAYWIENSDNTHYCSKCGHDATYNFDGIEICGVACPYCGSIMKLDYKE